MKKHFHGAVEVEYDTSRFPGKYENSQYYCLCCGEAMIRRSEMKLVGSHKKDTAHWVPRKSKGRRMSCWECPTCAPLTCSPIWVGKSYSLAEVLTRAAAQQKEEGSGE